MIAEDKIKSKVILASKYNVKAKIFTISIF